MSVNIWNLSQTKTSFFIRERTEAQKKHLNKLKTIKSKLDDKNLAYMTNFFSHTNQPNSILQLQDKQKSPDRLSITNQENSIIDSVNGKRKINNLNTSYIDNLRISNSLSRLKNFNQIQKQNSKIVARLISTKASISDNQFMKNYLAHLKYKQNILKNRYSDINPDYTQIAKLSKKSNDNFLLKPIDNLTKLTYQNVTNSRLKTHMNVSRKQQKQNSRIKQIPQSQNNRFKFREINNYQSHGKQGNKS